MNFLKKFYIGFVQLFATLLLKSTNVVLRHLIILKGKDPDFVPPPPAPPPPPPEPVRTAPKTLKPAYSSTHPEWVTDITTHPVIVARRQFDEKQAKLKAAKASPVQTPQVTTTTEIGGSAINALREAVSTIEQAVQMSPETDQNKDSK